MKNSKKVLKDTQIPIRTTEAYKAWVDGIAAAKETTRVAVIKAALDQYASSNGFSPYNAETNDLVFL